MPSKRLLAFFLSLVAFFILYSIFLFNQIGNTMKEYSEKAYQDGARAAKLDMDIPCPYDSMYKDSWYEGYMDYKEFGTAKQVQE